MKGVKGSLYEEDDIVKIKGEAGSYKVVGVYKKDDEYFYDLEPYDQVPPVPSEERRNVPENDIEIY